VSFSQPGDITEKEVTRMPMWGSRKAGGKREGQPAMPEKEILVNHLYIPGIGGRGDRRGRGGVY